MTTAVDAPVRPEPGPDRMWGWVAFDEAVAYEASVRKERGWCHPLLPVDQVERLRVDCEALATECGMTDTLVWKPSGLLVEVSGQWDSDGNELQPGATPVRTWIQGDKAGLYCVGATWTWRVVDHVCRKCHRVLHRLDDDWSASDGTACGGIEHDDAGDPVTGNHEPIE